MAFIRSPKEMALLVTRQRKKLKLSQLEAGKLVGLGQKTLSAFENKPENTQLETLFRILSALNLEINISDKAETDKNTGWNDEW